MTILAVYWEDQQDPVKSSDEILASIGFNAVRINSDLSHTNAVEASTLIWEIITPQQELLPT